MTMPVRPGDKKVRASATRSCPSVSKNSPAAPKAGWSKEDYTMHYYTVYHRFYKENSIAYAQIHIPPDNRRLRTIARAPKARMHAVNGSGVAAA